jgi:hypothetical protein
MRTTTTTTEVLEKGESMAAFASLGLLQLCNNNKAQQAETRKECSTKLGQGPKKREKGL